MADVALTEIQHTAQGEADLYKKMAPEVEKATGQPTTPTSLKPEDDTALEEIGNLVRFVGSSIEEGVGGKTNNADVLSSEGKKATNVVQSRGFKMGLLHRLGLKKAA